MSDLEPMEKIVRELDPEAIFICSRDIFPIVNRTLNQFGFQADLDIITVTSGPIRFKVVKKREEAK